MNQECFEENLITVFDLETDEGLIYLKKFFSLERTSIILNKFFEFVAEFDEDNYQDAFRIRIVSCFNELYDNKAEYEKLVTCCGYDDRIVTIDSIEGVVFEFGCNYGH
jgi:hypothetical protein